MVDKVQRETLKGVALHAALEESFLPLTGGRLSTEVLVARGKLRSLTIRVIIREPSEVQMVAALAANLAS